MATHDTSGVILKFARAKQHIHEIEQKVHEYLSSNPFQLWTEDDEGTGDLVTRVNVVHQPPIELSTITGDALHNARSALDHLAWHMVERNGGEPGRNTCFPVSETEVDFNRQVKRTLRGASESDRSAVRKLAAYPGGDDRLYRLHRLDIEDKHRLLIPVGMTNTAVNIHVAMGFNPDNLIEAPPIPLIPTKRIYPIISGAVIFRVAKAAQKVDQDKFVAINHSFDFELAFGTPPESGEPILPTLVDLIHHAEKQALRLLGSVDKLTNDQ